MSEMECKHVCLDSGTLDIGVPAWAVAPDADKQKVAEFLRPVTEMMEIAAGARRVCVLCGERISPRGEI